MEKHPFGKMRVRVPTPVPVYKNIRKFTVNKNDTWKSSNVKDKAFVKNKGGGRVDSDRISLSTELRSLCSYPKIKLERGLITCGRVSKILEIFNQETHEPFLSYL